MSTPTANSDHMSNAAPSRKAIATDESLLPQMLAKRAIAKALANHQAPRAHFASTSSPERNAIGKTVLSFSHGHHPAGDPNSRSTSPSAAAAAQLSSAGNPFQPMPSPRGFGHPRRAVSILPPDDSLGDGYDEAAHAQHPSHASQFGFGRTSRAASTASMGGLMGSMSIGGFGGLHLDGLGLSRAESLANSRAPSVVVQRATLTRIIPNVLALGAHRNVNELDSLQELGIRAFLCVAKEVVNPLPRYVSQDDLDSGRVVFKHMMLSDSHATTLLDHIPEAFEFIDRMATEGRPVALYCQQGKSRSVSFVIAYMMRHYSWTAEAAIESLQDIYSTAEPNFFFLSQLRSMRPSDLPPKNAAVNAIASSSSIPSAGMPAVVGSSGWPGNEPGGPSAATSHESTPGQSSQSGAAAGVGVGVGASTAPNPPTDDEASLPSYLRRDFVPPVSANVHDTVEVPWVPEVDDDDNEGGVSYAGVLTPRVLKHTASNAHPLTADSPTAGASHATAPPYQIRD